MKNAKFAKMYALFSAFLLKDDKLFIPKKNNASMSVFHRLHVLLAEIENLLAKKMPSECIMTRLRENPPFQWWDESRKRGKDYPFAGITWEVAPSVPQEPHEFIRGSSQNSFLHPVWEDRVVFFNSYYSRLQAQLRHFNNN